MTRSAIALLALALAAVLVAPAVLADDDWGDGARSVDTEVRADGFEMTSDRLEGAQHDRIRLSLDGSNVAFRFELLGNASTAEAEAGLRIRLDRIVEFQDRNGDGALQPTDEVRQDYGPSDLILTAVSAANVTSEGVPGTQVTATYAFRDAPNATLAFRATAFGNVTAFENLGLRPVETKIDIVLASFPYTESETLPAVELRVESETLGAPAGAGNGVTFRARDVNATFTWKRIATVDGVERPVGVTLTENGPEAAIAFAYARGSAIEHDPTVGFSIASVGGVVTQTLGNPLFYAVGALAAVAVFGSAAVARKGRKVKGK